MKTIYYLYLSIIAFFLFFFLSIFIINGNPIFFDMPIYHCLIRLPWTDFFLLSTFFGEAKLLVPLIILSYFLYRNKNDWKFFTSMMILECTSNLFLKFFFGRPRPNVLRLVTETGYSFPSGHMMASTMFYGLCIYFLLKTSLDKKLKILGCIFFTIIIFIVGMSRIYLGVHYFSDIIGGFLISLCLLSFGIFFYESTHLNVKKSVK